MEIVDRISECLAAEPDVLVAILHGSHVRGAAAATSDVDCCVAGPEPFTAERLRILHARLASVLGHDRIDLCDLRRIGGLFLHRVLSGGRVLINRDPALLGSRTVDALDFITDVQPAIRSGQDVFLRSVADAG
jgi:predicted nucleotidyltransferase